MPYWNLGQTFDYAEMAYLMVPRPFMVERGHLDLVGRDAGSLTSTRKSAGCTPNSVWRTARKSNSSKAATASTAKALSRSFTGI